MTQLIKMLGATCLLISASSAMAADWWLVYGDGEKPTRQTFYVDASSLDVVRDPSRLVTIDMRKKLTDEDLVDYISIEGVSVFESARLPAKAAFQYRIRCRERMIAAARKSQLWRDGKIEWLPDTDWAAVDTSPLSMQIHTFACDPKHRDANGMLRVTSDEPMATTWAYFWTDGTEPKWTSTRSAEEINAEIDAKLAEAREVLAQGAALAGASLNRIESEREETINNQQKLFAQLKQKASPVLHSWMGLPERALVASWGVPQQSYESGGSRFLYYAYGYTTELVDQYGNEIPQESWACHMTFEVRDGLIADYRSHGNYCQTAAANLPYGRPRE